MTLYAVTIKWSYLGVNGADIEAGDIFQIALVVNDSDGSNRGFLAYFDGIATRGKGEGMGYLVLLPTLVLCSDCGELEDECVCVQIIEPPAEPVTGSDLVIKISNASVEDLESLELNGVQFTLGELGNIRYIFYEGYGDEAAGFIKDGSIIITLYEKFLIWLGNENYILTVIVNEVNLEVNFTLAIPCEICDDAECVCPECAYCNDADCIVCKPELYCGDCEKLINDCICVVPLSYADFLAERAAGILRNGLTANQLRLSANNNATLTLVLDGVEFILARGVNNRNVSGSIELSDGSGTLVFDIRGNGSNVREFRIIRK
jgi:hypothetical protein